ncbi:MAG: DUF1876 family protein [Acidimicrobiia bacterium]|nr:DUF1876 family protein [Acidimicrobiia bacterium]
MGDRPGHASRIDRRCRSPPRRHGRRALIKPATLLEGRPRVADSNLPPPWIVPRLPVASRREQSWNLRLEISEDDQHCEVIAHLDTGLHRLTGTGRSRRNPSDVSMPRVGEELAAARALHDLANHLTDQAWAIVEAAAQANA